MALEGTEKKKMTTNEYNLNNNSFINAVRKRQQTLYWLLDFDWLLTACDYLILTFHLFILVKFFILARKMRHNARQSDNN